MYSNILVPVSFDEDRDAAAAIDIAKVMRAEGGKITLFHVIEQLPAYVTEYMPPIHMEASTKAATERLTTLAATCPGAAIQVVEGSAGWTIVDWAKSKGVDCIVVASHRPGMQDYLLGSTAARVVRHAPCAVHVVR